MFFVFPGKWCCFFQDSVSIWYGQMFLNTDTHFYWNKNVLRLVFVYYGNEKICINLYQKHWSLVTNTSISRPWYKNMCYPSNWFIFFLILNEIFISGAETGKKKTLDIFQSISKRYVMKMVKRNICPVNGSNQSRYHNCSDDLLWVIVKQSRNLKMWQTLVVMMMICKLY